MKRNRVAIHLNRKAVYYGLSAVLIVAALILLYSALQKWEFANSRVPVGDAAVPTPVQQEETGTVQAGEQWYAQKEDVETILLLGIDKMEGQVQEQSYRNTQQADFLMLLIVDHQAQTCTGLHINRDTMTQIQQLGVGGKPVGSFTGQLALAHTYGDGAEKSCLNTVDAVSHLLYGTEIDHYISLTMDAVAAVNDAVGGVTVTVQDDFSAIDPALRQGETVTLRGEQALTYVRARGSLEDSSNLARMERQRQYFQALYERVRAQCGADEESLSELLLAIVPYMVSDCTVQQLSDLWEQAMQYEVTGIEDVAGEAVQGEEYMEFYVDEEALRQQLIALLYEVEN